MKYKKCKDYTNIQNKSYFSLENEKMYALKKR